MPFVEGAQSVTPDYQQVSDTIVYGNEKEVITNEPLKHPPPTPWSGRLTRGYIVRDAIGESKIYKLHFWLNPSKIDVSYAATWSALSVDQQGPGDNGQYMGDRVSFSFELLFDRTEDILEGRTPEGCIKDVNVIEGLMGMTVSRHGPRGVPHIGTPYLFIFGGDDPEASALVYKGFITNAGVSYTSFMHNMVPKRMALSLQCELRNSASAVDYVGAPASGNPPIASPTNPQRGGLVE